MKTFNKDHLPDSVHYNGKTYYLNTSLSFTFKNTGTGINNIKETLKQQKRKMVIVAVLSKNLMGKNDLHGKPYKPSEWIFTTNPGE